MIQAMLQWAEVHPFIEKVTLNVFSTNINAISVYENCGFTVEGRCPRDMKLADGTYIDSVLMFKFVKG
jgi:RimJ/RimL family protein N-acetyltransferase